MKVKFLFYTSRCDARLRFEVTATADSEAGEIKIASYLLQIILHLKYLI